MCLNEVFYPNDCVFSSLFECVILGVEGVQIDAKNQKVIVKGKKADPIKVAERLRKKSGKHVELIDPKPMKEEKEVKKPEVQYFIAIWCLKIVTFYCHKCTY